MYDKSLITSYVLSSTRISTINFFRLDLKPRLYGHGDWRF